MYIPTDDGRPMKLIFHRNPKLLGLGRQFGQMHKFWGIWGIFGRFIITHFQLPILVLRVPCPFFPLINHYFNKKLRLYIQILKKYLGVVVELDWKELGI